MGPLSRSRRCPIATSYNGWPASQSASALGIKPLVVQGETFTPGVLGGDVHVVFTYLAEQFHRRVEPLVAAGWHQADDWGYYYRQNRNAGNLSCHSSGTAIDINATRHPNGRRGTFSRAQVTAIREILRELGGVVRWGGDFSGTPDEMHFEIAKNRAEVAAVAARLRAPKPPAAQPATEEDHPVPPTIRIGARSGAVRILRALLMAAGHNLRTGMDGDFDADLDAQVRGFQKNMGLTSDGVVGPDTWTRVIRGAGPSLW